jgi:hypothetical protein
MIAAATVIAACGANSPGATGSGSQLSQAQIQQGQQDMVRFADCMRSHGVPSFPDPNSPRQFKDAFASQTPAFRSGASTCQHLLPRGGPRNQTPVRTQRQLSAILAFARCMRTHGFPNFPDPTHGGQITHEMLAAAGIDLHQPAVPPTADACVGVTHGVVTEAAVARFVAGQ